ncbi:hypothetical protein [Pseudomonas sp. AIG]
MPRQPAYEEWAFRLDMFVEGANDNLLGIECDGDAFHGSDRWESDMNRQRILERAGWTFWRCFASSGACIKRKSSKNFCSAWWSSGSNQPMPWRRFQP